MGITFSDTPKAISKLLMKIFSLGPDEDRRTCWKLVSLKNFSPVDEKISDYIINKSSPKGRGVWCCVDSLFFKSLHIQISYYGAQWWTHGCSLCLFMVPPLEDEACVGKTEPQQTDDVLYCHGCSLLEFFVTF